MAFASELQGLLNETLPGQHTVESTRSESDHRYVVRPEGGRRLALYVQGDHLADLVGSPGASQPRAPTDPYVTVSRHTALVVLII